MNTESVVSRAAAAPAIGNEQLKDMFDTIEQHALAAFAHPRPNKRINGEPIQGRDANRTTASPQMANDAAFKPKSTGTLVPKGTSQILTPYAPAVPNTNSSGLHHFISYSSVN